MPENYEVILPRPPPEHFFVDDLSTDSQVAKAREFLRTWPEGQVWNFKEELFRYLAQVSLCEAPPHHNPLIL